MADLKLVVSESCFGAYLPENKKNQEVHYVEEQASDKNSRRRR